MTRPLDLWAHYLSASTGVGQAMRLDTIDRKLSAMGVGEVVHALAQIAAAADRTLTNRTGGPDLARRLFPEPLVPRAVERLRTDPDAAPVSAQVVVHLACRALAHCNDHDSGADVDVLVRRLGGLLLALADHLTHDERTDPGLHLESVRLGLFFRLNDLGAWYGLAESLLFDVLPAMSDDPDFVDVASLAEQRYGLDLELFWVLTAALGIAAKEDTNFFLLPSNIDGGHVSAQELAKWREAWGISLAEARRLAKIDIESHPGWCFSAVYDRPVLLEPNPRGVVVRPAFLATKATPGGMFWPLRHAVVEAGGTHGRWSQFFGRGIEELGRRLLRDMPTSLELVEPEASIRARWGNGRCCDAVLIGDVAIAVDFVYHQVTRDTATTGDFASLSHDLELAVLDKLDQIDATLERVAAELPERPLYPLVVLGSPLPLTPQISSAIADLYERRCPRVVGVNPLCRPPAIIDLAELAWIANVLKLTDVGLVPLLNRWLGSDLGLNNFRDWLVTDGPGRELSGGGIPHGTWHQRLGRRLFGHDLDGD